MPHRALKLEAESFIFLETNHHPVRTQSLMAAMMSRQDGEERSDSYLRPLLAAGGSQIGQNRISLFLSLPKAHGSRGTTKDKARLSKYPSR